MVGRSLCVICADTWSFDLGPTLASAGKDGGNLRALNMWDRHSCRPLRPSEGCVRTGRSACATCSRFVSTHEAHSSREIDLPFSSAHFVPSAVKAFRVLCL